MTESEWLVWHKSTSRLRKQGNPMNESEGEGYKKAYELLQKGMESQAELMDGLKQEVRKLRRQNDQLRAALIACAELPCLWPNPASCRNCGPCATCQARAALAGCPKEG